MAVSPRSANYERLEGGMGPSSVNQTWRWRMSWRKAAVLGAFVLGVIYLGGHSDTQWPSGIMYPGANKDTNNTHEIKPETPAAAGTIGLAATSFETDPDLSKTTACEAPHDASLPLVQYALIVDAGSTGSRIHVYKFNNCRPPSPTYEYEVFNMTQPGLSSFAGSPLGAAKSLDPLMTTALRVVPEHLRNCTPVAVKATAGLRQLPHTQSQDILDAVEDRLRTEYPFHLSAKRAVEIMDGKEEGVYAWITANYLLGNIGGGGGSAAHDAPAGTAPAGTYAVLDLGGASTQIAFEPAFSKPDSTFLDGEHRYDLAFAGKTHVLYQHSYLGYGLMRARRHVHQLVDFMASIRTGGADTEEEAAAVVVGNPCLSRGTRRVVEVEDPKTGGKRNVTMGGEEVGGFEACKRVVELVMAKDAICEVKPCSFNGVYQPSLLDTFATGKVLLLSYFYDRLHPLLYPSSSSSSALSSFPITVATFASLASTVCRGHSAWVERWGSFPEAMEELEGRPEYCLDLTFMYGLLRLGYEFEDKREVKMEKKIAGTELGWCLGAVLELVGAGEVTCRV